MISKRQMWRMLRESTEVAPQLEVVLRVATPDFLVRRAMEQLHVALLTTKAPEFHCIIRDAVTLLALARITRGTS